MSDRPATPLRGSLASSVSTACSDARPSSPVKKPASKPSSPSKSPSPAASPPKKPASPLKKPPSPTHAAASPKPKPSPASKPAKPSEKGPNALAKSSGAAHAAAAVKAEAAPAEQPAVPERWQEVLAEMDAAAKGAPFGEGREPQAAWKEIAESIASPRSGFAKRAILFCGEMATKSPDDFASDAMALTVPAILNRSCDTLKIVRDAALASMKTIATCRHQQQGYGAVCDLLVEACGAKHPRKVECALTALSSMLGNARCVDALAQLAKQRAVSEASRATLSAANPAVRQQARTLAALVAKTWPGL
eukprot:m51a1_g3099 hypothetical protein (306) ;mRNA; f:118595-119677